ncbi:MAG TPA: hypothetical protein VF420_13195, partial [Casimicrobiaceae bacterium]
GADAEDLAKAMVAMKLLKSLEPAMVDGLLEMDLLSDTQKKMLAQLFNKPEPKKPDPEKQPETAAPAKETVETTGEEATT